MYRTNDNLRDYLLLDSGVANRVTGEVVELTNGYYKLLTDEQVWLDTKQRYTRLWRRFTPEMLSKLYAAGTPADLSLLQSEGTSPEKSVPAECTTDESVPPNRGKSVPVVQVNGKVYQSIREASDQLSIHRNTIKKRLDDPSNADYVYLAE